MTIRDTGWGQDKFNQAIREEVEGFTAKLQMDL
jgi:hypothetical protein